MAIERWMNSKRGWQAVALTACLFLIGPHLFEYLTARFLSGAPGPVTYIDGMNGGATIYPLTSPIQLDVSDRFTTGVISSFAVTAFYTLFRQIFSDRELSLNQFTFVWLTSYLLFSIGMTGYLLFIWSTHDTITVYSGDWASVVPQIIQFGLLLLVTVASAEFMLPREIKYSRYD